MKKIILTLGLSIAFTASPVLAENLIDQSSSTFEETRKTYIKPFVGYGIYPSGTFFAKEINLLSYPLPLLYSRVALLKSPIYLI